MQVTCAEGFRAGPLQQSFAFCWDSDTRQVACDDCKYAFNQSCLPIACPAFVSHTPGTVVSVTPDSPVLVGEQVTGQCAPGFRTDSEQRSKTFVVICRDDCSYSAETACKPVCNLAGVG